MDRTCGHGFCGDVTIDKTAPVWAKVMAFSFITLGRHSDAFAEVLGEGDLIAEAARSESWFDFRGACRNSEKRCV